MSGILDDVSSALREFRRHPGIALVIVFTLGGAMGVNTTLFSVVNSVWFQPWPVQDPDRVVVVQPMVSVAEWQHWAEQSKAFSGLAARRWGFSPRLGTRRILFDYASANYFEVLGVPIVRGNGFSSDEDRPSGSGMSAVISHQTWQAQLGADPRLIGRSISLGDTSFTVVGVAAPTFQGDRLRKHLWLPFAAGPRLQKAERLGKQTGTVQVVGRLASGVATQQAQLELSTLSRRYRADHSLPGEAIRVRSTDAYSQSPPSAQAQALLFTLLLAVTFLTLVACANVANLLLARGHARRGEIAVRLSLGATRWRLVRRLLIEAFVLSIAAGLLGIAIATVLPAHLFDSVPALADALLLEFRLDHRVFAWALGASVLACAVFGLAPALQCTRLSVSHVLKDAHGQSSPALKTSLPSMQALVSVVALGVAGLVLRSEPYTRVRELARAYEGMLVLRPMFPQSYDMARRGALGAGLLERLEAVSGVRTVAAASIDAPPGEPGESRNLGVSSSYFDVLRIPIVAGRTFERGDPPDRVLIVNEAIAARFWPGEGPLGKTLTASMNPGLAGREVLAVVRDGSPGSAELVSYYPISADAVRVILVRDADQRIKGHVAPLVAALDPSLQVEVLSGSAWIARTAPGSALGARVVGEFGVLALVLATLGLFSLSDYAVRQRTREIGIRTALGARPRHVLVTIFQPASRALFNGVLWGTAGAACVGFVMRRWSLPSGVDPLDLVNYAAVALILALAGLVATYVPARHAMRIQPSEALRYE